MISYLKGTVLTKKPKYLILLVNNIGYQIFCNERTLNNLKEDYQDVIIYRYLDELSVPEIAKIVQKSEDAVRVSLHRALKSLKNELNLD